MTSRRFKLSILVLFGALFVTSSLGPKRVVAFSGGPPNGVTGAPGEPTCAVSGCHSTSPVNSGSGTLTLTGLGGDSDQVFLILFGTAFRGRSALAATSATIGGAASEVSFAGPQGSLAGLDQANLRIPRGLAGRGNVDVVFKADNKNANTVTINVK